jgi:hypothetical protein
MRRFILSALLALLAIQPAGAQCSTLATDSAVARSTQSTTSRYPAVYRIMSCVRAEQALRARARYVQDSVLAKIVSALNGVPVPTPEPTPVPEPTPTPVPAPSPSALTPNLPAGLNLIADYGGGDALVPGINEIHDTRLVLDATAPTSPNEVRRHTIPAVTQAQIDSAEQHLICGYTNDTPPKPIECHVQRSAGKIGVAFPAGGLSEVYIARRLKPSANLIGDPAGSKSMMLGIPGVGSIYFNYETTPDVLIRPIIYCADPLYHDKWLARNRASTPIPRGTWGLWEFYVKLNTPGAKNGILRVWANGVLQAEYTDIMYLPAGSTAKFNDLKTDFYQNRAQTFAMWWDMDHKRVLGR